MLEIKDPQRTASSLRPKGLKIPAIYLISVAVALFGAFPSPVSAKVVHFDQVDKVLVVVLDRVSLEELNDVPAFEPILDEAAVGVVSSPVAGSPSPSKFFLSLGTGNFAGGSWIRESAYQEDEDFKGGRAGDRYKSRAGTFPPPDSIVELDIFSILKVQQKLPRRPIAGYLGDTLSANGHKAAVVGNADHIDPDLARREIVNIRNSPLIVMDSSGIVPFGDIGPGVNMRRADSVAGISTDNQALKNAVSKAFSRADIVVVELGQTTRLEVYKGVLDPERQKMLKGEAIAEAAGLIGTFQKMAGPRSRTIVISPTPPNRAGHFIGMSPMLVLGQGVESGILTSPTTRRAGVVGNVDFAPTILDWFGVKGTPELPGRPVELTGSDNPTAEALKIEQRSAATYSLRAGLVSGILVLCFGVFAGAVLHARSPAKKDIHKKLIGIGAMFVMSIPAAFLLAGPMLPPQSPPLFIAGLGAAATLLTLIAWMTRNMIHPVIALGMLTIAAPLIDLLFGLGLMFDGILSYSPIYGARYYGIGNEAMSIMLGALLIVIPVVFKNESLPLKGWGLYGLILFMAVLVFIAGFPDLGANMGGTVTVGITAGIALLLWTKSRLSVLGVTAVVGTVLVFLTGMIALDASRSEFVQSHLGRTGDMVGGLGILSLIPVALRKALAGVSYSSDWLIPLGLLVAAAVASSTAQPRQMAKDLFGRLPLLKGAVSAVLIGGIVGLLSNDSGIMIPALMLIYFVAGLLVVANFWTTPTDSKDSGIS